MGAVSLIRHVAMHKAIIVLKKCISLLLMPFQLLELGLRIKLLFMSFQLLELGNQDGWKRVP